VSHYEEQLLLIDESISFELAVGRMYLFFSDIFPEDHSFWWQLAKEEENHASLLRHGRDYYLKQDLLPPQLLCSSIAQLKQNRKELDELYAAFETDHPGRETAANIALWLERSASESHYQLVMNMRSDVKGLDVFQQLNGDDKDHLERIKIFMRKKNIEEKEQFKY
jgi:hypothetical protein